VVVLAGRVDEFGPAAVAEPIAEQLPNSRYIQHDDWNHFTPFIDPAAMARITTEATG
jgi:pimeloyl-ACP methyl ester carboxylesterase